jgi:hypothetical protein
MDVKMFRLSISLIACCALLGIAVGCGDDEPGGSPFEGVYSVDRYTQNNDSCDSEGAPAQGDDFFKLALVGEGDDQYLAYYACSSADDCSESVNLSKSFYERDGDDWVGLEIRTERLIDTCEIDIDENRLGDDSNSVRIERRTLAGAVERDDDIGCDEKRARDNRDQLTCERFDVILASPIAQD